MRKGFPFISTSKTRKVKSKDMLQVEHTDVDERRIVDPYQADKLLDNQHGWSDPKPAPGK